MKFYKILSVLGISLFVIIVLSFTMLAVDYGAGAVDENETYTLEEILTFAIEDEYLAQARYSAVINEFGELKPFTNIVSAESFHIEALKPLFLKYGFVIPEDKASAFITVPDTVAAAVKEGIMGEQENMRMYSIFLKSEIPLDVKAVFSALQTASENHLRAFKHAARTL